MRNSDHQLDSHQPFLLPRNCSPPAVALAPFYTLLTKPRNRPAKYISKYIPITKTQNIPHEFIIPKDAIPPEGRVIIGGDAEGDGEGGVDEGCGDRPRRQRICTCDMYVGFVSFQHWCGRAV